MKVESFIEKIRTIDYPFSLDRKFEGNCPCFYIKKTFEGKTVILDGHCWRTCSECPGCGIHVRGTLAKCQLKHIARELKKRLDEQDWYGEWSIVYI